MCSQSKWLNLINARKLSSILQDVSYFLGEMYRIEMGTFQAIIGAEKATHYFLLA
jgi:hypothetical protein